jgi:hypothetical protein
MKFCKSSPVRKSNWNASTENSIEPSGEASPFDGMISPAS